MSAAVKIEASPYSGELPYLAPDRPILSNECLDAVEREWGVPLTHQHRQWVRFVAQLSADVLHYHVARRSPRMEVDRRPRRSRHKRIARLADQLAAEVAADIADESRAAPSLQEKLAGVDLALCAKAVILIGQAARSQPSPEKYATGRPSHAQWEDFVLALADVCRDAGGKPSTRWCDHRGNRLSAFWCGVAAINDELPQMVRVNVGGLAEHAHKHRWLSRTVAGSKAANSRASIF